MLVKSYTRGASSDNAGCPSSFYLRPISDGADQLTLSATRVTFGRTQSSRFMKRPLILIGLVQLFLGGIAEAQNAKLVGAWTVEVSFENGQNRSLRFEARASGKGSFALLGAGLKAWIPPQTGEATW